MGCDSFKVSKRHQQDRRALVCQLDKQGLNYVRVAERALVGRFIVF